MSAKLTFSLSYYAGGRLCFRNIPVELEDGAILRRLEVYVGTDVLLSLPFTEEYTPPAMAGPVCEVDQRVWDDNGWANYSHSTCAMILEGDNEL